MFVIQEKKKSCYFCRYKAREEKKTKRGAVVIQVPKCGDPGAYINIQAPKSFLDDWLTRLDWTEILDRFLKTIQAPTSESKRRDSQVDRCAEMPIAFKKYQTLTQKRKLLNLANQDLN